VPVHIPDKDGFVHSAVDCSTTVSVPGDSDGDTVPDPVDPDDDNDDFRDADELSIGTDHLDSCADTPTADDEGDDKWPPDFHDNRTVNILDLDKVLPPYFGSTSAHPNCSARKDLIPNGIINILDMARYCHPSSEPFAVNYVC
jgi:hypothetical protein